MKERKAYEEPSITVITMDAETDIIQTSTEYANTKGMTDDVMITVNGINSLFQD